MVSGAFGFWFPAAPEDPFGSVPWVRGWPDFAVASSLVEEQAEAARRRPARTRQ